MFIYFPDGLGIPISVLILNPLQSVSRAPSQTFRTILTNPTDTVLGALFSKLTELPYGNRDEIGVSGLIQDIQQMLAYLFGIR